MLTPLKKSKLLNLGGGFTIVQPTLLPQGDLASSSALLRNYSSICSTILRSNLARMILHQTGGGRVMPVHIQMDEHILEDG